MKNETEFANQGEEISYKDMWLELKKTLESRIEDYERRSVLHVNCHEYAMNCLAKVYGFDEVLEEMDDIEGRRERGEQ